MVGPIRALLFVPVLLIAACGGGTDEAPKGVGDHVFSAQQKALEKAKEMSQLLQDAAERKRKQVEAER